jgi:hypothetical protein
MHELTHVRSSTGWRADLANRRRLIVVLWSVIVTAIAVAHYLGAPPPTIMQTRLDGVASSLDVLDHGGPPLLVSNVPYHKGVDRSQLYPAGTTDDQGIYMYLPVLGHWTGEHDPATLMLWLYTICFGFLILVLPILMLALFDSVVAAIAAPILVLFAFNLTNTDLYWIQAWMLLLGLPGVLLAYRWWGAGRRRGAARLLVGLTVAASFATSIRAQAGLAVAVAAAGVILLAGSRTRSRREWGTRLALLAAIALAYASVAIGFAGVRAYRDHVAHPNHSSAGSAHPFWHPAYLGLGYLPNKYGIAWLDAVGADAVQRAKPGTAYLSPQYESTLRKLYTRIVEHDPGFALHTYFAKARVIGWDALRRFWLLPLLLVVALTLRRRNLRAPVLIALPALVIGAASPLLSMPFYTYELGWLGAVGASWLLAVCWGLSHWPQLRKVGAQRLPARPTRAAVVVSMAVVAAAALAATGHSAPASSRNYYSDHQSAFAPLSILRKHAVARWRFAGHLPAGWRPGAGTTQLTPDAGETTRNGLHALTATKPDATALSSPVIRLTPGRYRVAASGRVLVGGVLVTVSDVDAGATLGEGDYWWLQGDYLHNALAADFAVKRSTRVRLTLRNWTTIPNASAWVLWSVALQRLGAAPTALLGRFYARRADALVASNALGGTTMLAWPFVQGTPQGWSPVGTPQQAITSRGLDLRTSTEPSGYQLGSQTLALRPGRYAVAVAGRVLDGGLEIGVLDAAKNSWITTQHFWDGQPFAAARRMTASFSVAAKTKVRLLLSNWAPSPRASEWLVREVDLIRLR